MRFICVSVLLLAVLRSVSPATAGSLERAGAVFEERGYKRAFQLYIPLAEQGVSKAMARVAKMYASGRIQLAHMKKDGHLAPNETVANKPATTVVKVSGGVRQTITAVHPKSSPVQEETSKAWWLIFSGLVLLLMSVGAFFSPRVFMYGRRSWFWRELIGERATATMIRIVSFPVGIVGILIMLTGILAIMEG